MRHNRALFQMTDASVDSAPAATWAVTNTWDSVRGSITYARSSYVGAGGHCAHASCDTAVGFWLYTARQVVNHV
jgi:hypothetical protein